MNLRIVFKFKDCKLQFYEKRRLFCYFSVNPCMPASRWHRLLKLKQKQSNALKSLKSKKSLQESTNRASECHSPHHIYNSLLRMRAIHELKMDVNIEHYSFKIMDIKILEVTKSLRNKYHSQAHRRCKSKLVKIKPNVLTSVILL